MAETTLIDPSRMAPSYEPGVAVGVIGGIPDTSGWTVVNVTGLTTSGTVEEQCTTNAALINDAIAGTTTNTRIVIPSGTWKTYAVGNSYTPFTYPNGYNFELVGSGTGYLTGEGLTKLEVYGSGVYSGLNIGDTGYNIRTGGNPLANIVSGLTQGSTQLVLDDASPWVGWEGNKLGYIDFENTGSPPVFNTRDYVNRTRYHGVFVTSVNTTTKVATLSQAIPVDMSSIPGARLWTMPNGWYNNLNCGVKDLWVDVSNASYNSNAGSFAAVTLGLSTNCYFQNVRTSGQQNYAYFVVNSINCEARGCNLGMGTSGSNRAGLLFNSGVGNFLFEDNIVLDNYPGTEINFGTHSCAFIANYIFSEQGYVAFNINHGPYNVANLYEGNVTGLCQADGYFGGTANDTFYGNWFLGKYKVTPESSYTEGPALSLKRFTRNTNVVGNINGTPGISYSGDGMSDWGQPNMGNSNDNGFDIDPENGIFPPDYDEANDIMYVWTGVVTSKTDANNGVVLIDSGQETTFNAAWTAARSGAAQGGRLMNGAFFLDAGTFNVATREFTVTLVNGGNGTFPDVGTICEIVGGPTGYQEFDLGVAFSAVKEANYYVLYGGIPAGEAVPPGDFLKPSIARDSKPSYFGTINWPPFMPTDPDTSNLNLDRLPASWRASNLNDDYLGGGTAGELTVSGTTTVSGVLSLPS